MQIKKTHKLSPVFIQVLIILLVLVILLSFILVFLSFLLLNPCAAFFATLFIIPEISSPVYLV